MKHLLCLSTLLFANAAFTTLALAEDMYAGATISKGYDTTLKYADNHDSYSFTSNKKIFPYKLFVGYKLNDNFGLEGGYKNFGTSRIGPIAGTENRFGSDASAFYLAGTATVLLDDSWSLFGKLGVASTRVNFNGTGLASPLTSTEHKNHLHAGVGAAYNITQNLALTLEFEHFGEAKGKNGLSFGMNGFSAGVKVSF